MAKWSRAHQRELERLEKLLEREARPFDDTSEEAVERRRSLPFLEPEAETDWCRTYMPHYFDRPSCSAHKEMVEAVGESGMPTFIAAFRGFGKSVILTQARPVRRIVSRSVPYIIFGAQVQGLAAQMMSFVRLELGKNARIRSDYGEIKVDGGEDEWIADLGKDRDRKGQFTFRRVKCKGFGIGQDPRGERFAQHRPWEFVGDDLESQELARNPKREKKLWQWLYDSVLPGLDREHQVMTIVGTLFGPGCMMDRAEEASEKTDPEGRPLAKHLRIPAIQEDGTATWPEGASLKQLERIRAQVGLKSWNRNYALISKDPDKPFQGEWFVEYDPEDIDVNTLDVVAFLDPAVSESASGCPRAVVVVGANRKTGHRYILDAWIERGTPQWMIDKLFEAFEAWQPRVEGIEENGGYAILSLPLQDAMRRRGWIPTQFVTHTKPKDLRIESLVPAVEQGRWHIPRNPNHGVRKLIEQFLSYPDGFVDGPDACAGCDELLPGTYSGQRSTQTEHRSVEKRDAAVVGGRL